MKLRSIQVLRGIAACSVVVMHAYASSNPIEHSPFRLGAVGVDLFFVISGFIIATIAKKSPGDFLFDRVWRIFPIWLIAVLPLFLFTSPGWTTTMATVTLWPVYDRFTMPVLPIGWTLSFEMLFYLSAALALRTRPAVPLALFGLFLVLGMLTRHPLFDFVGNPLIFEFLMGAAIARLPRDERFGPILLLVAAFLLLISPLAIFHGSYATSAATAGVRALFWGFPAALMVYGCLSLEKWFERVPVLIGNASYSIYLFHVSVIQFAPVHWVAKAVLAVSAGVAVYLLIERPIQRSRERARGLWRRARHSVRRSPQDGVGAVPQPNSVG